MPLDPIAASLLESMAAAMPPIETMTPREGRAASASLAKLLPVSTPRSTVAEHVVRGEDGDVRVRTYRPPSSGPLPAFVYIHGGGWVIGGEIEMFDSLCDELACAAEGYRLAPEHPFPTGLFDCLRATRWAREHADDLDIQPGRVAIGGDSSGGNLTAALALLARDQGDPPFCLQLLVYPPTDYTGDEAAYPSERAVPVLTPRGMAWYWRQYAGTADPDDPYLSPLRAVDLNGLPPAVVITAEYDVLRAEADAYTVRLRDAGVAVTAVHYDDMFHGFFGFGGFLPQADAAVAEAVAALRKAFGADSLQATKGTT
ncbi:MAG: alpha/beta hydrolase [Actinobacteria bacterium]|nr:alpha/beta hydrolase [Actinomycetota bacterium]